MVDTANETSVSTPVVEDEESYEWPAPLKTVSLPIQPVQSELKIKEQISAPGYFHSLGETEPPPPFRKPDKEPKPKILVNTIITEVDVIQIIAAKQFQGQTVDMGDSGKVDIFKKFLGSLLVEKQVIPNYNLSERDFLISLINEVIDYAAQRDFNERKLACMITIYLATHLYFRWYYWSAPAVIWAYFKEVMIRHTIQDSPDGEEVFEPAESYDIITHFHTTYMNNLPLVHIVTFCSPCIKFEWAFNA